MMGAAKVARGMGFRDVDSFNSAMLAKQCWRILTNPNSLSARILKEKYFKKQNLLSSKLGWCPSVMWRGLWSSLKLLKEGIVSRVGNGKKIKIWDDKWVSSLSYWRSIQAPMKILNKSTRVEELIDVDGGVWKEDLIEEVLGKE